MGGYKHGLRGGYLKNRFRDVLSNVLRCFDAILDGCASEAHWRQPILISMMQGLDNALVMSFSTKNGYIVLMSGLKFLRMLELSDAEALWSGWNRRQSSEACFWSVRSCRPEVCSTP